MTEHAAKKEAHGRIANNINTHWPRFLLNLPMLAVETASTVAIFRKVFLEYGEEKEVKGQLSGRASQAKSNA